MNRQDRSGVERRAVAAAVLLLALSTTSTAVADADTAPSVSAQPPAPPPLPSPDANAAAILAFATAANGGERWLHARSNVMEGHATLCRDADPAKCVHAERYVMYRGYPREVRAAHAGTGRFRLDAVANGRVLFQTAFDGTRSYDQDGPLPPERAASEEASAFGFSAIRFAREPGFRIERLTDDDVEGRPCFLLRVTDPSGSYTLFAIDREDGTIRMAAWPTPRGWHHRLYSDYYWVPQPGFRQPGRVRLYYQGLKTVDIRWTRASIDVELPESLFVLPQAPLPAR